MPLAMLLETDRKLVSAKKLAPLFFLLTMTAVDAIVASFLHIRFTGFELIFYVVIALLVVSFIYSQFRKNSRLSEVSYYVALWGLFTATSAPFTYMAAAMNFPLHDKEFVVIDQFLRFDWRSYYELFASHKITYLALMAAYYSFVPQLLFSVIFFAHIHAHDRNDELFWTASISIVITGVTSGIFPAAGAFYHFGTGLEHAVHLHDFFALRSGTISEFVLRKMEGIVTFPSYHTVAAILLIYVYRGTRIFLFMLALNILMLLSTPVFGGHYFVDMLSGGVAAFFSIAAAKRIRSYLKKSSAPCTRLSLESRNQSTCTFEDD